MIYFLEKPRAILLILIGLGGQFPNLEEMT